MAVALTMKGAVSCSNMMMELGFYESFGSVSLYIDNTSALHVAGNRTYSFHPKHITLVYVFLQELEEESKLSMYYAESEDQLEDLGIKNLRKHRHRDLIKLIDE